MSIKCAECQCAPQECKQVEDSQRCENCTKEVCCCLSIHHHHDSHIEKPLMARKMKLDAVVDDCCAPGICKNDVAEQKVATKSLLFHFFRDVKRLYAAALGIEILCILAAEIGENTGLYIFGFNLVGIPIAYAMGYALAGFTTFVTILGRYNYGPGDKIDSCCSVLEQGAGSGFIPNLKTTFKNFATGIARLPELRRQPNLKYILKTSTYILVTAESACILTAETVDLIFYQYSILLSVPLALVAGAFTVVAPEAYMKMKRKAIQS
jgi:hypothetical protein